MSDIPDAWKAICATRSLRETHFFKLIFQPIVVFSLQFTLYGTFGILFMACTIILRASAKRSQAAKTPSYVERQPPSFTSFDSSTSTSSPQPALPSSRSSSITSRKIPQIPRYGLHLATTSTLYFLATASIIVNSVAVAFEGKMSMVCLAKDVFPVVPKIKICISLAQFLYIMANMVADAVLVWRCWVVWGSPPLRSRKVLYVGFPAVLCVANSFVGMYVTFVYANSDGDLRPYQFGKPSKLSTFILAFSFGTLVSNMVLTLMIAGRIWHISRQTKEFLGRNKQMYQTAINITLESGLMYPMAILIYISTILAQQGLSTSSMYDLAHTKLETATMTTYWSLVQFVGIAPTVIIVRIGLRGLKES